MKDVRSFLVSSRGFTLVEVLFSMALITVALLGLTATVGSGSVIVRIDQATAITFATTYASVGGTPMQYRLDMAVEQL